MAGKHSDIVSIESARRARARNRRSTDDVLAEAADRLRQLYRDELWRAIEADVAGGNSSLLFEFEKRFISLWRGSVQRIK